tara:strand:- start:53 stop:274 length:222 start_codon:yes stop_codon:yes gene_type:complete
MSDMDLVCELTAPATLRNASVSPANPLRTGLAGRQETNGVIKAQATRRGEELNKNVIISINYTGELYLIFREP